MSEEERRILLLRKWASMRLQTLYRTMVGMMKHRQGLLLLLHAQLPELSQEELEAIVDAKFTCVAALQRYSVMRADELADVEILLREFPMMCVAYIHEEDAPELAPDGSKVRRFFSCMIDGSCELNTGSGRRQPKYKIELPGHPILGNGKSDNQNHAIVFTRGSVLQAIDANQEGYLEETLKVSPLTCVSRWLCPIGTCKLGDDCDGHDRKNSNFLKARKVILTRCDARTPLQDRMCPSRIRVARGGRHFGTRHRGLLRALLLRAGIPWRLCGDVSCPRYRTCVFTAAARANGEPTSYI